MTKIGLIDFGVMGNIDSVRRALSAAGGDVVIVSDARGFASADKLVLPGVGGFHEAMEEIRRLELHDAIRSAIESKITLGICLGMQILASIGYEFGETEGLNLIQGEVKLMECKGPVPHIGFNTVETVTEYKLFKEIAPDSEFYFMHSYEFVNYTDVAGLTDHFGHKFVSAVARENIHGVQFHPEKSREQGIQLLKNFIDLRE
jgi:glutamine amidotransferase